MIDCSKPVKLTITGFRYGPNEYGRFIAWARVWGSGESVCLLGHTNDGETLVKKDQITAELTYKEDPQYGPQYEVQTYIKKTLTKTGVKHFLAHLYGISSKTAEKVITDLGEDVLGQIRSNPDVLYTKTDLRPKQIDTIINALFSEDPINQMWRRLPCFSFQQIKNTLELFDIPINSDKEILLPDAEADKIVNFIREDPYRFAEEAEIPFAVADELALNFFDYQRNNIKRLQAGFLHILKSELEHDLYVIWSDPNERSNTFKKLNELLRESNDKWGWADNYQDLFFQAMTKTGAIEDLVFENFDNEVHLYHKEVYDRMQTAAQVIAGKINDNHVEFNGDLDRFIQRYEKETATELDEIQGTAVKTAASSKISIITGGPGTGKSTIIDFLATGWKQYNGKVLLLSPTGRAVNVLRKKTKNRFEAMTVAKALTLNKVSGKLKKDFDRSDALIIIDETSMLDLTETGKLLGDFKQANFCLVGDKDQLPPVGPGYFFHNLIKSQTVPCIELTIQHRCPALIQENAPKVNSCNTNLTYEKDFNLHELKEKTEDAELALMNEICDTYVKELKEERKEAKQLIKNGSMTADEADRLNPYTTILLSPVNDGVLGTKRLNIELQDKVNPESFLPLDVGSTPRLYKEDKYKGCKIWVYGKKTGAQFRIGDLVVNHVNMNNHEHVFMNDPDKPWTSGQNHTETGIYNGDIGRIIGYEVKNDQMHESSYHKVYVQLQDGSVAKFDIDQGEFDTWDLGYALTVHKAQGSEYPRVLYVSPDRLLTMPEGVGLAAKNTIYTAITRSSYRVHLFGSKESIDACIQKNLPEFHDTFIKHLDNAIEEDKIKEQVNEKETDYLSSDDDLPFEIV